MQWNSIISLVLVAGLATLSMAANQDRVTPAEIPVHDCLVEARSMDLALQGLANQYKIVIGIDFKGRPGQKPVSAFVAEGVFADVLNALVVSDPGYVWSVEPSGAIHFRSRSGAPTLPDMMVDKFVVKEVPAARLQTAIHQVPEVRQWTERNHCPDRTFFVVLGQIDLGGGPKISLDLSHVTFGQILDELALKSGSYSWAVNTYELEGRCYSSIVF